MFLVVALAAAVLVALGGASQPVHAAPVTFTVNTVTDEVLTNPLGTDCVSASGCSLRAALEAADNRGADVTTINVPDALGYNLDPNLGALQVGAVSGEIVHISGTHEVAINQAAGCTETVLRSCMVFFLDPGGVGDITVAISGLTIEGGHTANAGGGGGILGGSLSATSDSTTISNCVITGNTATGGPAGGGGISYAHGSLAVSNCDFLANHAVGGSGGGIDFVDPVNEANTLTVANSVFGLNTSTATLNGGGGAIHLQGAGSSYSVTGTLFDGNTASTATVPGGGGAILKDSGTLSITGSTFTGNSTSGAGGAVNTESDDTNLGNGVTPGLNRFVGNSAASGNGRSLYRDTFNTGTVTAENNWWGTNTPNASDAANVALTHWFVLQLSANPTFVGRGGSTTLTADLSHNNAGTSPGLFATGPVPILVAWAPPATLGSLSGQTTVLDANAQATATYTADAVFGTGTASVTVDGQTVTLNIIVLSPPTIAKVFAGATVPLSGDTKLTFNLTNPNSVSGLTGIGFTDSLPAGLALAHPGAITGSCGTGTITAAPGSAIVSLSGGSISASGSCSFSVMVTGVVAGTWTNTTGIVDSTEAGSDGTASASIDVVAAPTIAKSFSPSTIELHGTSSLSFTIANPVANAVALTGVAFTDALPAGLTVANSSTTVCGGSLTTAAPTTTAPATISLSGAMVGSGSNCTFAVTVTGAASGTFANQTSFVTSSNGGRGNQSFDNLTVIGPPIIAKSFSQTSVAVGGTSTLTFSIDNPNDSATLTGVAFTDNLPAGLLVATPNGLTGSCGGGTIGAAGGSKSVSLSGATLAAGASCSFSVNVVGATLGDKDNSVTVTSTEGGPGNTSTASITVAAPPTISKVFGASSIPLNGSTTLTFTISNPNGSSVLTGVGFTDTLPAGLVLLQNSLAGTCGGVVSATAGSGDISFSGATVPAGGSCVLQFDVTGTTAGVKNNTTGSVTSTEGGTGGTASASIVVVAPPSIDKSFSPASIAINGSTVLGFAITNPNSTVALAGVAFTDALPTGLMVANSSSAVCGGTLTTTVPTTISLSGASVAAGASCNFAVTVAGAVSGDYTNTTGPVSSTNGGTGNTASANLLVASPPTIVKSFSVASVPLNGSATLSFTIGNPNTTLALTGVAFTDGLPAGLVVATPNALAGSCGAGIITAVAGSSSISLSGGTLAAGASCTFSVDVIGTTAGVKINSVRVTSIEGGDGNSSNASIVVVAKPTIVKVFGAASIPLNGSTSLTFTIGNPDSSSALTGVGFTDSLPAGLVVQNSHTAACGGVVAAAAGSESISLSGATIAAGGTCSFAVDVTGTSSGVKNNTTGSVTSTEGGSGGTASASIVVVAPPSIAKTFSPTNIAINATTVLTFTITNPNSTVALTGVAFTDTLPTGLTVASGTSAVCRGGLTATAPTTISLSGAMLGAGASCTFTVNVTGATSGGYTNVTGAVTSTNGGSGNTASANLEVASPPTIVKSFGAASVPLNGSATLAFTINNLNSAVTLTGVGFTDALPVGLIVAAPNGVTGSCGGGTITAVPGTSAVSLGSATIAPSSSCTFSVDVTGTTAGVKLNAVTVTSNEGGAGNTSNASITVVAPPTIGKSFGAASIPLNGSTSLTFTIGNPNGSATLTGVGFSDILPGGLMVSSPNGVTGSCGGGTITAVAGSNSVSLSGASLAAGASCTFSIDVTGTTAGSKQNTTNPVASNEGGTGGTASASILVVAPPSITKSFGAERIKLHRTTTLTFTITNPNAVSLTGVGFTDVLPPGLRVSTPNGLLGSCGGGAIVATSGTATISLTGATLAANTSCTFSVRITGTRKGGYTNVTGAVNSTNGGTGNTASAHIRVASHENENDDEDQGGDQGGDQEDDDAWSERDTPDGRS